MDDQRTDRKSSANIAKTIAVSSISSLIGDGITMFATGSQHYLWLLVMSLVMVPLAILTGTAVGKSLNPKR